MLCLSCGLNNFSTNLEISENSMLKAENPTKRANVDDTFSAVSSMFMFSPRFGTVWYGMVFRIPYFQKNIVPEFRTLLKYLT